MSEKESRIRLTIMSPSGHLICCPLDKYEEYIKSQPGYKPPKPLTLREKIIDLVGDDSFIGFGDRIIQKTFSVDQSVEDLICTEFEREGLVRRDKDGSKDEFWRYVKKDVKKMIEIIEKYIKK